MNGIHCAILWKITPIDVKRKFVKEKAMMAAPIRRMVKVPPNARFRGQCKVKNYVDIVNKFT